MKNPNWIALKYQKWNGTKVVGIALEALVNVKANTAHC